MSVKKCPLCGGRLMGNCCNECGYELPDEASIAAPYNYDPSDYNYDSRKYASSKTAADIMPEIRVYDEKLPKKREEPPKERMQSVKPYANPDPAQNIRQKAAEKLQNANPFACFDPNNNTYGGNNYNYTSEKPNLKSIHAALVVFGVFLTLAYPFLGLALTLSLSRRMKKKGQNTDESLRLTIKILAVAFAVRVLLAFIFGS